MSLVLKVVEGIYEKLSENFAIHSSKCVRVRHKSAGCTSCMDVCPSGAIKVTSAGGRVLVDWAHCSNCGKCHATCRNGVFSMHLADRGGLFAAATSRLNSGGIVALSCRQSLHSKDADHTAATLAFYNRKHLVRLVAMGAKSIVVLKGDCDTCGNGCVDFISKEVDAVTRILSLCNNNATIVLTNNLERLSCQREPIHALPSQKGEKLASRREFFNYLKTRTMVTVGSAIQYVSENDAKQGKTVLAPESTATGLEEYVDSLKMLGGDALLRSMLSEGLLNRVTIDREKCTLCGICSRMCPNSVYTVVTGMVKGREKVVGIQEDNLLCSGCELCVISCPSKVISIRSS